MDIKTEIENLRRMPLEERAEQQKKSAQKLAIIVFVVFGVISALYPLGSPKKELDQYDPQTYSFSYKYPDGSIYNTIKPWTGYFIILGLGIVAAFGSYKVMGKRWEEYNSIITEAKKERANKKYAEKLERDQQRVRAFNATLDGLKASYGAPDTQIFIKDRFDINSYILPFSKVRKIMILGTEMAFNEIVDVQLNDDKNVIKGQLTAVTETDGGSMVGRIVVGGMVAGKVGAIIGGSTAQKNTTFNQAPDTVIHNYSVLITTKNISKPLIEIKLKEDLTLANNIVATIKAVIANK